MGLEGLLCLGPNKSEPTSPITAALGHDIMISNFLSQVLWEGNYVADSKPIWSYLCTGYIGMVWDKVDRGFVIIKLTFV